MADVPGLPARTDPDPLTSLAARWATIALATSHVAVSRADIEAFLLGVAKELVGLLRAEPFDPAPAAAAGAELVAINLTGNNALDETIRLLGTELLAVAGLGYDRDRHDQLTRLTGALASGYVAALRERLFDEQEMIKKAVFRARDIAERARRASEARWQAVFQSSATGIAITDLDGVVQQVNPALCDILGRTEQELLGDPLVIRLDPTYTPQVSGAFGHVARGEHDKFVGDVSFIGHDGEPVWTRLSLSLVRDQAEAPEYAVAVVENISDLHLLRERQLDMSLRDQLTGLPNRTHFLSQLDTLLQQAGDDENVALCYVDLDGFKIINDGVDHTAGDRVLKRVAGTLQAAFPEPTAIVARIGGDGFAVLLPGTKGSFAISERISAALAELSEPIYEDGETGIAVSASVGIVERSAGGLTSQELVRAAEITVHRAKQNGKAQWELFDAELDQEYRDRYRLGAAIPGALENGEFQLSYQPVRDLRTGELTGLRSLLHWQHPSRGLLAPADFLAMAEETGFIVPMGRWMLEQVCEQVADWEDMFDDALPVVSINLTTRLAREQDLVQIVRDVLDKTAAAPARLRLSVPAAAIVDERGEPLENIATLRDIDVDTVVHGFGSGNTGLVDLRALPVRGVVVAPSVVRAYADHDEPDSPFEQGLRNLVDLADQLGIWVVADDVDTEALAERLRGVGLRYGAGPAVGEPMSADDVTRLLDRL